MGMFLMPAPTKNTNARKGEVNRQMWSQRLPIDVIEQIKINAVNLKMSQADFVALAVRQYNKPLQSNSQQRGID